MNIINEIHLHLMRNGSHFTYVSHVLQQAEANTAVSTKAASYLAEFKKAVAAEDALLKTSAKSLRSDSIADADASRDTLYTGFKAAVRSLMRAPSAEMAQAAVELNQLAKDYRIETNAPMVQETGMLLNFLDDLGTKFKTQVETLGLEKFVGELREANSRVDTLMVERNKERQGSVTGALKAARKATDEAYGHLVMMVNGLVYVEGESAYKDFVDYVNVEILYFRREILGQKTTGPKADGNTPGTGDTGGEPGTENPGGDTGENPGGGSGSDQGGSGSDFD